MDAGDPGAVRVTVRRPQTHASITASRARQCPTPNCTRTVLSILPACRDHWHSIPPDLRTRLTREYSNHFGETSYFEARGACLRALGVPEDEIPPINAGIPAPAEGRG